MKQAQKNNRFIVELHYVLASAETEFDSVLELGRIMEERGFDKILSGGFWILDIYKNIEFYSNGFRKCLGFVGEEDFPSIPDSWQKAIDPNDAIKALEAYEQHKLDITKPYFLPVTYNTKQGSKVHLICAGKIVDQEKGIMIGTHDLIEVE